MNHIITAAQAEARKVNEGYKQMAGDVLMGGLPDVVIDQLIADTFEKGVAAGLDAVCGVLDAEQRKHNCPLDDGNDYDHGAWQALSDAQTAIKNLLDVNK